MVVSFKDLSEDIKDLLKNPDYEGAVLYGPKSRGFAHRFRWDLREDFDFVEVTSNQIPESSSEKPTVYLVDMKHFDQGIPGGLDGTKRLIIDQEKSEIDYASDKLQGIRIEPFLTHSDHDIDMGISNVVAELYLNVFDAFVDYEAVTLPNGNTTNFYFKTSELIKYDRSRVALEGVIASAILKLEPDVIASREIVGIPPEDEVKMFELAESIGKRLGIEAVMLNEWKQGDPEWMQKSAKYVVRGDLKDKDVLLLDDVLTDGTHKIEEAKAIRYAGGKPKYCIVLLDRNEGGMEKIKTGLGHIDALTTLDVIRELAMQQHRISEDTYIEMGGKAENFVPQSQ